MVLAGVHLGGWEVVASVPAAIFPAPTTVIVADNWLAWGIQSVRDRAGLRVVYRSAGALAAARILQRGEFLLILGDDASGEPPRRSRVRLCGSWAYLPSGIPVLSRLAQAPIVPFFVLPEGRRRWRVVIEPAIRPPERRGGEVAEQRALQDLADVWSGVIEANPDQWAAQFHVEWEGEPGPVTSDEGAPR